MAIQTVGPLWVPPPIQYGGVLPGLATLSLVNASGDKAAFVFRAPKTGNIHRIGIRFGNVTTPTDTDVRLETVSAQVPSGSLKGTNTNGTIASASVVSNAFAYATLTADAAVTVNDLLAIAIIPSGSPNFNISKYNFQTVIQMPYCITGATGSYVLTSGAPLFALEYDDGSYACMPLVHPGKTDNTHTFNSSSNPEIIGLKFKMASPFRVSGGWLAIDLDNSLDIVLYDSDGTSALQTAALTNAGRGDTAGNSPYFFKFPAAQSLLANTFYYIGIKPGASNVSIYSFDVNSAAVLDQTEGGQNFHYASNHTGTWTPVTTRRPYIGLEIDGIDDGVSAGGMVRHPGMSGGLNG